MNGETEKEPDKPETPVESDSAVEGEYYDTGKFKAKIPSGWKAFPQHEFGSSDPNAMNPNFLKIGKGASTEAEVLSKPSITIAYAADGDLSETALKGFYEDVEDMEDIVTGDHTWHVFRGTGMGFKTFVLFDGKEKINYQVAMVYEAGDEKIDLDDADVQAILSSIQKSE